MESSPSPERRLRCAPSALLALLASSAPLAPGCAPAPLDGPCGGGSEAYEALDTFWATLDAEYAVFAERLPDQSWLELGEAACAALPADPSDDALFDAVLGLARHLDDGHVNLEGAGRDADAWASAYPHYDALYTIEDAVEARYLDGGELERGARGWFAWGTIGGIGYLSLGSMDGLSLLGSEARDVAAARRAVERALEDLSGSDGIVVDVRANEGGWDSVSLEVASYFGGERALAWSEQVRDGEAHDAFGPWEDAWIEANADAWAGPVALLTSGGTFSAGETFALAMRTRPQVTIIGEPTSGHLSDMYDGALPNRWTFTFSGERYRAADGEIYEGVGIPVDVEVAFEPDALAGGVDAALDAALGLLGG